MPDETIDDLSHRRIRPDPVDERIPVGVVIAALRDAPWLDCGGGRFAKVAVVSCKSFSCSVLACQACRREHHLDYMLTDDVWRIVSGGAGLLCLPCAGERLGRPFRPDDFTPAPINASIRYVMGAKS